MKSDPLNNIAEPGDDFFRGLESEARVRRGRTADRQLLHAMVVIITDQPTDVEGSGDLVAELLAEDDFRVDAVLTVPSRKSSIRKAIQTAVIGGTDLVVTVGATGHGPRDKAPEATSAEVDRKIHGIAEALRSSGLAANSLEAGLSRGIAGVAGSTVIVNIAGTRGAIRDGMATLGPLVRHVIAEMNHSADS